MQLWVQVLAVLCLVALTVAAVPAILALRRSAERAERVLATMESELRPLLGEVQGLVHELRGLTEEARGEVQRVALLTDRAHDTVASVGRLFAAVAGLTRAGQLVGVAAGLKAGLDVFLHRLRRQDGASQGEDDEQRQA
ncbi:MAG TPA: DUF948 domain-containing protein [Candidatus Binatia bacterium]|nr:DUF948 domain-containing protein [Candidatus Binatia bacterium]